MGRNLDYSGKRDLIDMVGKVVQWTTEHHSNKLCCSIDFFCTIVFYIQASSHPSNSRNSGMSLFKGRLCIYLDLRNRRSRQLILEALYPTVEKQ